MAEGVAQGWSASLARTRVGLILSVSGREEGSGGGDGGAGGRANEQLDRRAKPAVPATTEAEAGVPLEPIKFKSNLGERLKSHIGKG